MEIDSHTGVGRWPVFVPDFAGMTTWMPDRVGFRRAALSYFVVPQQGMTVSMIEVKVIDAGVTRIDEWACPFACLS